MVMLGIGIKCMGIRNQVFLHLVNIWKSQNKDFMVRDNYLKESKQVILKRVGYIIENGEPMKVQYKRFLYFIQSSFNQIDLNRLIIAWKLNLKINLMLKKRSSSQKPNSAKKKPLPPKKKQHPQCTTCFSTIGITMLMQRALYRKYSQKHFSQPQIIEKEMKQKSLAQSCDKKQYLDKYYKNSYRKHEFPKIKQIYKLHQESPKLYMPGVKQIINKCHHRKRLLQYFKIAKILGIRVDTIKFSTFLLSLSKSHNRHARKDNYDPLIGQISGYEFSEDVQRQLIQTLDRKDYNI